MQEKYQGCGQRGRETTAASTNIAPDQYRKCFDLDSGSRKRRKVVKLHSHDGESWEGTSYLRLHHVRAVEPQVKDGAVDVHRVLGVQLLQHSVQNDEGPCTTHTSTAAHMHTETRA